MKELTYFEYIAAIENSENNFDKDSGFCGSYANLKLASSWHQVDTPCWEYVESRLCHVTFTTKFYGSK